MDRPTALGVLSTPLALVALAAALMHPTLWLPAIVLAVASVLICPSPP